MHSQDHVEVAYTYDCGAEVGGSDTWIQHLLTGGEWFHVYHCSQEKHGIFHPKARWTWVGIQSSNWLAAPKAKPKAKPRAVPKAKAKAVPKATAKARWVPKSSRRPRVTAPAAEELPPTWVTHPGGSLRWADALLRLD